MMKIITKNLLTLIVMISAGLSWAATYEKGYPDEFSCELGEDETAIMQTIEGKFKRPHFGVSDSKFAKDWKEISAYKIPEWLLDAKFGMYTHWGLYSIPGFKGNTYVRYMYTPGNGKKIDSAYYDYHKKNYGDPTEFGYTDFVPMFTCAKFDGDEYVKLMQETGAKFGGLCVVHHDGFLLWDSDVNRWNVGKMGPKRDIYGEFVKSARKANFKTCATFHHARSYNFVFKDFDPDFYTDEQKKKLDIFDYEKSDFFPGQPGGIVGVDEFARQWHAKIIEVIDKYSPDVLWFDGINRQLPNSPEHYVVDFLKYYLKQAEKKGQQAVICNKLPGGDRQNIPWFNFPEGTGIRCYEGGRNMPADTGGYWLVDRAISYPWTYTHDKKYNLDASVHVRALSDHVARGGIYLLSLTPMPSGEIHPKEKAICKGIGDWLKVNGEAIYGTRRWTIPAEGPVTVWRLVKSREGIMWDYKKKAKDGEWRFTKKGDVLYAILMKWPENGKAVVKSLKYDSLYYPGQIKSVEMLGSSEKLTWKRTDKGLEITLPKVRPCKHAFSLKIE